ncbi:Kinesin-like protein [Actinidia chinensis var. chinensis]|uniref:Kinesin-like protein n=1 Tax=Actinidia chinensis var. chinensis TaxID=1590841 RepID=A0A2R6RDB0_ACTCC|nr:Kinesin-like protein [Actinidia chinensis var. chinensis]
MGDTLSNNCNRIVSDFNTRLCSTCEADRTLETATCDTEQIGDNAALVDESDVSDGTQEMCSNEVQTLPILYKIEQLSSKVQNLKKEHAVLCNEVNSITVDSFLGSEVFSALQNLSTEHEHLKKKHHEECDVLKKKYLEECSKRKLLYNEVIELKGNIRVFCRCRPSNQDEIANGSTCVVDFDSSQENELQIICADSSRKQFKFDHVFRPEDNQDDVFVQTSPVVTSVLDGYNVCIFAYGQTGTGKTFTMEGTPENRGVNYRALEELFRISNQRSSVMRYELFVSMLEVYNEKIRDLLIENSDQPGKKLEIKQAADGVQEVPGLVEACVYGTDEVWELLKSGSRSRSVGSTNSNELSSRSHCLLRVTVKGESLINGKRTRSNLWLVDLAGSERLGKIEVEGERLKESQFINKSLSALGDVISALASKMAHIPYRNSKLTHLLQSSLGGDCKTLMFVQISPNAADLGETICSLNFASRVRGIEHGPAHKQADPVELFKIKQLAEKAKHDEKEMKKLQDSLQSLQLRLAAREHTCRSLQEKVRDLENQLVEERKIRQKQETRALAAVSAQSPALSAINQAHKTLAEKKPPLVPVKLRLPLRGITNFLPPPSPLPPYRTRTSSILPISRDNKENLSKMMMSATKSNKRVIKARQGSFVIRQPAPPTNQVLQPKRRASLATFRPETNSYMTTPLNSSNARPRTTGHVMGRQSFAWDPQRVWRASRVQSPMPRLREGVAATVMATPMASRSSKFVGSPPTQVGSWRPKHPTVVALQKKHLVWSPLKLRGMRNSNRKSFLPS